MLSPSLSLYAEKDSVCNCLVDKNSKKKDYLKGFSLITLTKDDEVFLSIQCIWLVVLFGEKRVECKFGEKGGSHSVVHVIETTMLLSNSSGS